MKTRNIMCTGLMCIVVLTGVCAVFAPDTPIPLSYKGVVVLRSESSAGSGFVFAEDELYYYIGTANHVVEDVTTINADGIHADIVAWDAKNDVAIVRVKKGKIDYSIYSFGHVKLEDHVFAVGYTWGNGWNANPTFMIYHGRITCVNWDQCLSSNSGVFPGMSGGPLFNSRHEVVGITSRAACAWGGYPVTTLSIFVPVDRLQELWNEYREN